MSVATFSELYCRQNNLDHQRYEQVVLKRSLYPHARWFYHLIRLVRPDHFAADIDLIRNVGSLHRFREFSNDVQQFLHHPANRGALRRTFNVRVSTKQLRRIVRSTMRPDEARAIKPEDDRTAAPFETTEDQNDASASITTANAVNRQ